MRLYKIEITSVPEESLLEPYTDEDGDTYREPNPEWKPEGWEAYIDEMADCFGQAWARRAREEGYKFFWPSTQRTYKTKESAESKAWAVRKWGGTAVVLVAEVGEFVDVEEVKRRRQEARDSDRAEKLAEKALQLTAEAETLLKKHAAPRANTGTVKLTEGYVN